jgi:hypothetical protein
MGSTLLTEKRGSESAKARAACSQSRDLSFQLCDTSISLSQRCGHVRGILFVLYDIPSAAPAACSAPRSGTRRGLRPILLAAALLAGGFAEPWGKVTRNATYRRGEIADVDVPVA